MNTQSEDFDAHYMQARHGLERYGHGQARLLDLDAKHVEDVVDDVLADWFSENGSQSKPPPIPGDVGWGRLCTAVRIKLLRENKRQNDMLSLDDITESGMEERFRVYDDPFEPVLEGERKYHDLYMEAAKKSREYLDKLADGWRKEAFVLKYVDGWDQRRIAEHLSAKYGNSDITHGNVRVAMLREVRKLKRFLGPLAKFVENKWRRRGGRRGRAVGESQENDDVTV